MISPICSFADRQFYEDWWNSTSQDEFSRKWNKPVHTFLLKHVYAATIMRGATKSRALFITFLLSACAHELVMVVVTRKIRMYLFTLQVCPAFFWYGLDGELMAYTSTVNPDTSYSHWAHPCYQA